MSVVAFENNLAMRIKQSGVMFYNVSNYFSLLRNYGQERQKRKSEYIKKSAAE